MDRFDTILVTGANGFVGTNLVEYLESRSFRNTFGLLSSDCDLTDRKSTLRWFQEVKPKYVFHMAGYVNGIAGNMKNQGNAYLRNVQINTNVIEAAQMFAVKKIVAMGTVAMYPPKAKSEAKGFCEGEIFDGPPHDAEKGYAHAKRAMLAQLDTCGVPFALPIATNMFGGHDRFDVENGHCIPSLVRKSYEAGRDEEPMRVWGDGSAKRDFMYIKDVVMALHTIMEKVEGPINLATGVTHSIKDVVAILKECCGCTVEWDKTKPVGQMSRSYDVSRLIGAGFLCQHSLEKGLRETYEWYSKNEAVARKH